MNAISSTWLLAIAGGAGLVILSGRAGAIFEWAQSFVKDKPTTDPELALIVNIAEAGKLIQEPEQRKTVREACVACFMGWINSKFPA